MTVALEKAEFLERWRGVLSAEEVADIQRADSLPQAYWSSSRLDASSVRVRFHVEEWLTGGDGGSFEVFTDLTSCGYRFETGKVYLVSAYRNGKSSRWKTGACVRNAPVESRWAQEDVKALRAFRDGHALPRIYGQITDSRERQTAFGEYSPVASARLKLMGESYVHETLSDAEGWFAFDNLPRGRYQMELLDPLVGGKRSEVDLTDDHCAEVSGFIERNGQATVFNIHVATGGRIKVPPSPTALEEPSSDFPRSEPWRIPPPPLLR